MNCAEFQVFVLGEDRSVAVAARNALATDPHVSECEDCRAFLEAAAKLYAALSVTREAPRKLSGAVMAAISVKPSYLPEVLDLLGWAAMLAVIIGVAGKLLAT